MIFFLFYNIREEEKIPSVEGCEIEVAREVPGSWLAGVKQVVPPPSNWICRDKRGIR